MYLDKDKDLVLYITWGKINSIDLHIEEILEKVYQMVKVKYHWVMERLYKQYGSKELIVKLYDNWNHVLIIFHLIIYFTLNNIDIYYII